MNEIKSYIISMVKRHLYGIEVIGGENGILFQSEDSSQFMREIHEYVLKFASSINELPLKVNYFNCCISEKSFAENAAVLLQSSFTLLLLDYCDYISCDSVLFSTALTFTDQASLNNNFIVASCSKITPALDAFTHPYRLGTIFVSPLPTEQHRTSTFYDLISSSVILCEFDYNADYNDEFCNEKSLSYQEKLRLLAQELAKRTQGLRIHDIVKLLKEQVQNHYILSLMDSTIIKISASKLLNSTYSNLQLSSTTMVTWTDDDKEQSKTTTPHLLGLEHLKNKLLIATTGSLPSSDVMKELLDIRPCSGIVISGCSGSGKTSLANWLAYTTRSQFKFISVSCADLVHKVVGETEQKISQIFRDARRVAPCFILLDNLETIVGVDIDPDEKGRSKNTFRRSRRTQHRAIDRMLSTLLVEIDGVREVSGNSQHAEKPVIVIATTTNRALLDRALVRPGRLELHVELSLPDHRQRCLLFDEFFSSRLEKSAVDEEEVQVPVLFSSPVAQKTVPLSTFISSLATVTAGRSFSALKSSLQESLIAYLRYCTDQGVGNRISGESNQLNWICSHLTTQFSLIFF